MNNKMKIFETLADLKGYSPSDGEISFCEEDKKYYLGRNNEMLPLNVETKTKDGIGVSLYEINRQIISQLPNTDLEEFKNQFNDWVAENEKEYFLLYGKEINYFTLFKKDSSSNEKLIDLFFEILKSVGIIKDYSFIDNNTIEIWVKTNNLITCLYFFNYEEGVVKFE